MDIYAGAFKKWADNIIDNGVPHNNWNLMQARYIMSIGMIWNLMLLIRTKREANIILIMC